MARATFANLEAPRRFPRPYRRPTDAQIAILLDALRAAWARVRASEGFADAVEDQLNTLMDRRLKDLLDEEAIEGFYTEFYGVGRERKVVSSTGAFDQMPDLHIDLRVARPDRLPADYVIEIECKPVPASHKLVPYYGEKGMGRFVDGRYAKTMCFGMMIAYAADGYTFEGHMRAKLTAHASALNLRSTTAVGVDPPITVHGRDCVYADDGSAPGDIELLHLWLPCVE